MRAFLLALLAVAVGGVAAVAQAQTQRFTGTRYHDRAVIQEAEIANLSIGGTAVTATAAELNALEGITASVAELNILDGVTATAEEINQLDLSVVGAQRRIKVLQIAETPTGAEQSSGWTIPALAAVEKVCVVITAAEATGATKTLDVGTDGSGSNDPDGYLRGVSVATPGIQCGAFLPTAGSNNTYVGAASTHTRGELLTELLIAGVDEVNGGDGVAVLGFDSTSGGETLTFTAGSNDWDEFRGIIVVWYTELAVP